VIDDKETSPPTVLRVRRRRACLAGVSSIPSLWLVARRVRAEERRFGGGRHDLGGEA
jgi:hypothetical protein